jgi:nitroreductase
LDIVEYSSPVCDLVRRRRSCRKFLDTPLAGQTRDALEAALAAGPGGPFGGAARFTLVAATAAERAELKGLGTYGFIAGATAFIIGAIERGPLDCEGFGQFMERAILKATDLRLGTCWLGGTFAKSAFARRIGLRENETMPAVAAVGYPVEESYGRDRIRRIAGSNSRRPAEELFFDGASGAPLPPADCGAFAGPLEMVRLAPSASNKQPWRVLRAAAGWHFYLQRTKGYGKGTLLFAVLRLADLQRVDMGIAMCHFELAVREAGLAGSWVFENPELMAVNSGMEYTATWRPAI